MIQKLFEAHLKVRHLERAMAFYGDLPGLTLGLFEPMRRAAFYWIGGDNVSMLGLWEKPSGEIASSHIAFEVSPADMEPAIQLLRDHDVKFYNFLQDGTDRPMVFGWMPAVSIYFTDPDGHELEFIAPLPEPPRPALGVVPWEEWKAKT